MAKSRMSMSRKGKNQSDLKPIRRAIERTIADLKRIKAKKKNGPTPKQKLEIAVTIVKLHVIRKRVMDVCCDGQHNCPAPDPSDRTS
jgi:hypothetical protein